MQTASTPFRSVLACLLSATLLALPACITVQHAASGRISSHRDSHTGSRSTALTAGGEPAAAHAAGTPSPVEIVPGETVWPERWGDDDPSLGKGVIVPLDGPLEAWQPRRNGIWHRRLPRGDDERHLLALARGRADGKGYRYRMEGGGAFIFERSPDAPVPPEGRPLDRSEPAALFAFVSGRPEQAQSEDQTENEPRVDIERTWFAYYDHRRGGSPEQNDPGLGTIMLLPGLFGVPEQVIDVVTSAMRQRGWNVIRMLAPPARFVEQTSIEIDPASPETADAAAHELMHRVAETAYASEAAWDHVLGMRPGLAELPKLAFGGSGGALALPAVVRRDRDRYDGAVIVAGGANILDVVTRSTYTKPVSALDFAWKDQDGTPPAEVLEPITERYLAHAPLDGEHAGAWMGDLPVLMLEASNDKAVPVENSVRLWERLGEPEKWRIQGSHLTLFMSLWLHTPRILDWVESEVIGSEPEPS